MTAPTPSAWFRAQLVLPVTVLDRPAAFALARRLGGVMPLGAAGGPVVLMEREAGGGDGDRYRATCTVTLPARTPDAAQSAVAVLSAALAVEAGTTQCGPIRVVALDPVRAPA